MRKTVKALLVIELLLLMGGGVWNQFIGPVVAEDAAPSVVVVTVDDSSFSPEEIKIKAGTEVVWKNKGFVAHTVTANDGSFDSGSFGKGSEYKRKFTKPGTFPYFCEIHPYMTGTIVVQ